jgi:hypothetical protein
MKHKTESKLRPLRPDNFTDEVIYRNQCMRIISEIPFSELEKIFKFNKRIEEDLFFGEDYFEIFQTELNTY